MPLSPQGTTRFGPPLTPLRSLGKLLKGRRQEQSSRRQAMHVGLSPLQSGHNFEATTQDCERAEALGFDSIWLGEHHNHPLLYPTPLIGLAAIASRTRRLRLGTGVLLLPLYHPLAVAEEGAMVDMISGGRLILGMGAGSTH